MGHLKFYKSRRAEKSRNGDEKESGQLTEGKAKVCDISESKRKKVYQEIEFDRLP